MDILFDFVFGLIVLFIGMVFFVLADSIEIVCPKCKKHFGSGDEPEKCPKCGYDFDWRSRTRPEDDDEK